MLEKLTVYHSLDKDCLSPLSEQSGVFYLETCQRVIGISHGKIHHVKHAEIHQGAAAYEFLLEVICGLRSKLIAENEIVGQFKIAYQKYLENPQRPSELSIILEKLFLDAKWLRTNYLHGLCNKTYGSIVRRILTRQKPLPAKVVVTGSGQLAEEVIQYLRKYTAVSIWGRNEQRVSQLADQYQCEIIPWNDSSPHLLCSEFAIVNTIGVKGLTLFEEDFFLNFKIADQNKVFIDLGAPSSVVEMASSTKFYSLEDIFREGALNEEQKWTQVYAVKKAILDVLNKRLHWFREKLIKKAQYEMSASSHFPQIQVF